jgi:large subunit ribosomal protein L20
MVRTTNVPVSKARRKKKLKIAKGFTGRNKNLNRVTSGVVKRSLANQYIGRKLCKRDFRRLWITRIGIAARNCESTYGQFMNGIKKAGILLNRKIISELAISDKETFTRLVAISKEALSA